MKISRTSQYNRRRRNPLILPSVIAIALLVGALAWFWHRGGPQPQQHVEKAIPTERLGR
jgi:hypothetical protein